MGGNVGGVDQAIHDGICSGGDIAVSFRIDANTEENCATVEILDDGVAGDPVLFNLSDTGCLSGTIGTIPLNIGGEPGQISSALIRVTLTEGGLSNGSLGATVGGATAAAIADLIIDNGGVLVAEVFDINEDVSGDTAGACDALSMTLTVGGATETPQ